MVIGLIWINLFFLCMINQIKVGCQVNYAKN